MTPGFSLRRLVFRRRYLHAVVAADPHEAATRCINYWASRWRSTVVETPGMREQFALNGWVGTEIADGLDTMGGLFSTVTDAIARSDLFPILPLSQRYPHAFRRRDSWSQHGPTPPKGVSRAKRGASILG